MALAGKKKKLFDGRYEVLSIVGRGSCSVVYQARHGASPHALVALKVLLDKKNHGSNTDRLRKEALALVSARHKHVVRLDDFHSVGDLCYLSMEYAPESDLRKYCAKLGGRLPLETAERFMVQAAEALDFVHQVGMVHRDIKPDNTLVIDEGEIRLADFGVAMLPGEVPSVKDLQTGIGTMNYMAPEVLEGQFYDKRSDIYALGVTLYEMVGGAHPFEKAALLKQLEVRQDGAYPDIAQLAPGISPELAEAIMRSMSYRSEDRPSSAREIVDLLAPRIVSHEPKGTVSVDSSVMVAAGAGVRESRLETGAQEWNAPHVKKKVVSLAANSDARREDRSMGSDWDAGKSKPRGEEQPREDEDRKPGGFGGSALSDSFGEDEEDFARGAGDPSIDPEAARNPTLIMSRESVDNLVDSEARTSRRKKRRREEAARVSRGGSDKKKLAIWAVIALVVLYFGSGLMKSGAPSVGGIRSVGGTLELDEKPISPLQMGGEAAFAGEVDFPLIPSGLYAGAIDGFLPDRQVALTMMSLADKKKLVVILGVEGWTPKVIDLSSFEAGGEQAGSDTIRVAANGFVLDFTGQKVNDEIVGTFRNSITGEQGEWKLAPSR